MPHSKTEIIRTVERRLRQLQSQGVQQDAAFFLAVQNWERQQIRRAEQERVRFRKYPLALALHDVFHGAIASAFKPDAVDQIIDVLMTMPRARLRLLADRLDHKGAGRPQITLAEIDFRDFHFWWRVTKKRQQGMTMRAACGAVAAEDGDRTSQVDSLAKRYRRMDKRCSGLRRYVSPP